MTSMALAEKHDTQSFSAPIKVAVVDDSAVVRGLISRWISEGQSTELCGRYSNGKLAVEGVANEPPDVIILDIEMPVMDGLTALPELLKNAPDAKVIMASTLTRRNAEISLKALSLGATDYIPKPESNSGVTTSTEFRKNLLDKVLAVGKSRQRRLARPGPASQSGSAHAAAAPSPISAGHNADFSLRTFSQAAPRILAIGSSTGGPQALATFFEKIAPTIQHVPVVLTQHMPATFTAILAERLGKIAGVPSREGIDGEPVQPGHIYVAPGGLHMALQSKGTDVSLRVYDGEMINFCKPAVDPLFDSVSKIYSRSALAVVLTGMGADGANGSVTIANAGGTVMAQDEATSVVWGMPGAAAQAGACAAVLPLDLLAAKTASLLKAGL